MFEGNLVPAYRFLDYSDKVKKVKYSGEILYNVLLAEYGTINVNNLMCETLHPDNIIAKLYMRELKEQPRLICQLNSSLENKDFASYTEVVHRLTHNL
jgi:ornithine carbamoyltransferase